MLNRTNQTKITAFLMGMGLSQNQARKLAERCRGSQPVKLGSFEFTVDGDRFNCLDTTDGLTSGLNLDTGEII